MARKRDKKPGSTPSSVSLAPGQVIDGESSEVKDMAQEADVTTHDETERSEVVETQPDQPVQIPEQAEQIEDAPVAEPDAPSEAPSEEVAPPADSPPADSFSDVTLANGSVVTALTPVKCGKCGAQFYAKDATNGCPAETLQDGIVMACGGTVGPVVG